MNYQVSFGRIAAAPAPRTPAAHFRLVVLGDLTGAANAGRLETGPALAKRKPIAIDVDNFDDVLARLAPTLHLAMGDGAVAVPLRSLDDFHPDQLVENVELFETLLSLRRDLSSKAGFARAAKEVMGWGDQDALPRPLVAARGTAVASGLRLDDFARLTGRAAPAKAAADVDDLVRRLVGPFIEPGRDPQQPALIAQVDAALSAAMRRVLHHPDFQAMEAVWRTLDLLVRRIETGARAQIVLYDVTAEEWAADLAAADDLGQTGLHAMLVEQPALDADQGLPTVILGLYGFELSPPHADLLGRMAQVAAASGAPFLAALDPDGVLTPMHEQNPLIRQAWTALQGLPAAAYLGLATPRFLLRMPYGKKSDPIDAFAFEEFTREAGLSGMLWANPAAAAALVLAQSWAKAGPKMTPGQVTVVGDMPYYVYIDPDGDQVALPCTERLWSERQVAATSAYHVMPVVSLRGRPEIRIAGFASVAGPTLAGAWAPVTMPTTPPAVAPPTAVPPPPPPVPPEEDLDSLLASLAPEPAAPEPAAPEPAAPEPAAAEDDLDALLASLSAEPPPAAPGETEADLDALLASL